MTETIYPAPLLADFYKISHREQYPPGTEQVYSTWIPRESRVEGVNQVVVFGIQSFIQTFLLDYFNEHFFNREWIDIVHEYRRVLQNTLGIESPETLHLLELHQLGYLPLRIKALPEGTLCPLRVPMATVENTDPRFFWLTNFIETLWSTEVWLPSTSATTAHQYRTLLDRYALETTGSTEGVDFQAHDFSMRGMSSLQSAAKSGAAHLLSFLGTDSIPAISYLEKYYGADITKEMVGTSIPATEHSVACSYGDESEREYFRRMIQDVYPSGLVSVVSDTWDLWNVLTETLPSLRDEILGRDGKLVIRPDSGNPVDIVCGTREYRSQLTDPVAKGVVELLWDTFGGSINEQGYRVLDPHIGCIYGDGISPERAEAICERLKRKGFASTNIVFGVGSYTYQRVTRDTYGFAMKSTWVKINGEEKQIFKDPATDTGHVKRSLKGRVAVVGLGAGLVAFDGLSEAEEARIQSELRTVFEDGVVYNTQSLSDIRGRLAA